MALSRDDPDQKYVTIGRTIQRYSRFFEPFSFVPGLAIIGETAKAITKVGSAAEKAGEDNKRNLSSIKSELNDLLKGINRKVIIIIDDIDRLTDTEIRQIFQLVKSLADFQNTIFVKSTANNISLHFSL